MMKKAYLLISFGLFLQFNNVFSQKPSLDVSEVKRLMTLQQEAWNKGSLEGFMTYYWKNDSLKFIGSKGITYGWQQTLTNYKKNYGSKEAMGQLTFDISEAQQLSTHNMFVIGKWHLKKSAGDVGGYFTLLWKKINGKWVIVVDHTS